MAEDPLAPKINSDTLKGIISEHKRRTRTNGFTRHVEPPQAEPNRFCKICTATWRSDVLLAGDTLQPAICEACQQELDKGQIAVIVPNTTKHCFVYSFTLAGHGPIIECSEETFEKMKQEADKQGKGGKENHE